MTSISSTSSCSTATTITTGKGSDTSSPTTFDVDPLILKIESMFGENVCDLIESYMIDIKEDMNDNVIGRIDKVIKSSSFNMLMHINALKESYYGRFIHSILESDYDGMVCFIVENGRLSTVPSLPIPDEKLVIVALAAMKHTL